MNMESMKKYPIYRVNYSMEDEVSGINLVSIVDDPAIQLNSITLSEEASEIELFLSNEEEMRVVGPALVPDKPIFRKKNGGYFIYFTKEDIKNLVKKFNRTGSNSRIGLDHNGSVSDAYINEQWIVEDPSKDKSSFYNLSVEPGTWMLDVQITDENLWNEIKKKKTLGFSIEAMLGLKINDVSMSNDELREDEVVDTNIEETTEARVEELSEGVSDVETTEETTETTSEESTEETVNETEETVEEVVEEVTEAELSEDMPTDVAESPEVTVDMEGKMNQLEMMIAELIGKVSSLESKVASESEVNMKNEAILELSRHSKIYDDVMAGKEEFRNLEKKDKSKFLLDRIEQIAKNVKK